jgi:hypothetical protein
MRYAWAMPDNAKCMGNRGYRKDTSCPIMRYAWSAKCMGDRGYRKDTSYMIYRCLIMRNAWAMNDNMSIMPESRRLRIPISYIYYARIKCNMHGRLKIPMLSTLHTAKMRIHEEKRVTSRYAESLRYAQDE